MTARIVLFLNAFAGLTVQGIVPELHFLPAGINLAAQRVVNVLLHCPATKTGVFLFDQALHTELPAMTFEYHLH